MEDGPDFTYDEKTVLASGGYGNVHKGNLKDRTNTPVVVKVPKTKAASISIEEEYAILRKLRRTPGIVHLHSMRKTNEMCTIALELANGSVRGLLRQHKGGLSLEIMKCLVGDMKMGLRELVAHNILHRDIKPDNILYFQRSESDYSFKLSDFGTSKAVASMDETAATICGTAVYMTPQLLGYYIGVEGCTKPKGNQCDSWSTGVTLYECATGDTPFGSMGLLTLYRVVQGIKSRTDAIAYRNKEYQTKLSGPKFEDEKWRELEKLISSLLQQRTAKDFLPLMAVFADRHAEEAEEDDNNNDMRMSYTPVVGIDLGTTFSVAGIVLPNGKYEIISNQSKTGRLTPSCVAFAGRRVLVGEDALEQRPDNYLNTISQVKRCMGRTEQEISKLQVHNHIQSDASGSPEFRVQYEGNEVTFSPQEISAMILRHMKILAESALADATGISDLKIADAVITVPASFNNDQRKATRDAANIAGLNVLQLLNEPTAAAIAYGLRDGKPRKILVYDLGGGTFDVSIIEMNALNAKVIVTMGEQHLGGEDFDQALLSSLIGEATQRNNMQNMFTMLATCERLKRDLTAKESVSITLPDNSRIVVTRASFTELIEHRLQQTITMVEEAMAAAKLKQADIDDVVLAGGSTRIPRVSELLAEKFGRSKLRRDIDADEAIGMGAIVLANALRGKSAAPSVKLSDVIPKALGSAVRGPSNSLVFSEFIRAFTPIPCSKERSGYTNSKDRQTEIRVPVYEDNCNKSENKIGQLSVPIAPRKADENKIAIKFCVDHNGILTVTATDLETNLAKSIKLDSGALTIDRVDAMRAVAEQMVRKDAQEDNMQMLRAKIEKRLRDVKRMAKQPHELAVLLEQQSAFKRACAEGADVNERDLEILCGNLDKLKANWHSVADIKEVA